MEKSIPKFLQGLSDQEIVEHFVNAVKKEGHCKEDLDALGNVLLHFVILYSEAFRCEILHGSQKNYSDILRSTGHGICYKEISTMMSYIMGECEDKIFQDIALEAFSVNMYATRRTAQLLEKLYIDRKSEKYLHDNNKFVGTLLILLSQLRHPFSGNFQNWSIEKAKNEPS